MFIRKSSYAKLAADKDDALRALRMEMLSGVLPDIEADKLEAQIKVISKEIEYLLTKPRTVQREQEVGSLKNKADELLRDYHGL